MEVLPRRKRGDEIIPDHSLIKFDCDIAELLSEAYFNLWRSLFRFIGARATQLFRDEMAGKLAADWGRDHQVLHVVMTLTLYNAEPGGEG